jgi:hypothetical protein
MAKRMLGFCAAVARVARNNMNTHMRKGAGWIDGGVFMVRLVDSLLSDILSGGGYNRVDQAIEDSPSEQPASLAVNEHRMSGDLRHRSSGMRVFI